MTGWAVERRSGTVGQLHDLDWTAVTGPTVFVLQPTAAALVLGSAQFAVDVDDDACRVRGVDVVRRRSGGGAVLVQPQRGTWIDVVLPRHDPRWVDDVGRSAAWLGDVWVSALAGVGVVAHRHDGPTRPGRWGRLACFAGVGPGEVVGAGGAKLVGIAQRRTRTAARFQCLVHHDSTAEDLAALLAPTVRGELDEFRRDLDAALGVVTVPPEVLVTGVLAALGGPPASMSS